MSFQFGNVVVVEGGLIGVIVKSWADDTHDVYVRSLNRIKEYRAIEIQHFVYSKELAEDEIEFYT